MEDDTIRSSKRLQRQLLPWTLRKLAAREASAGGAVRTPEPLPVARAQAVDAATERACEIARRVRGQAYTRFAFPWRFEEYPLAELAEPPTDAELEAWMQELDFRYQRAIEGDEDR